LAALCVQNRLSQMTSNPKKSGVDTATTVRLPDVDNPNLKIGKAIPALVLLVGPAAQIGQQWKIDKKSITLGRYSTSDVQIKDVSLSKVHARFTRNDDGSVAIIDMESTNGTLINGKKLTPFESLPLRNNDQIKAGNVVLKFLEKSS
jgi:pSer/pThr/pTyr-binding forkhead associated (FHA) protein